MVTEARLWLSMKCAIAEEKNRENCRKHDDSDTEQKDQRRGKREEHPRWFVYQYVLCTSLEICSTRILLMWY